MNSEEYLKTRPVSQRLGIRLRRAMFAVRRLLMSRLAPLGFTNEQYAILLFLGEQDGITQTELAERSFTNPNTLTAILNRLEGDGLIRRIPHESDGRAFRVEITSEGKKTRRRLMRIADEITQAVLGDLSPRERDMFLQSLDTVAEAAEEALSSSEPARSETADP